MSNKLMIQVFGPFRRDQFVAALDAIDSELGTWIGRLRHHRSSAAAAILGQTIKPLILANETFVMLNIVTSHFGVTDSCDKITRWHFALRGPRYCMGHA
jgi:hypothetical protein